MILLFALSFCLGALFAAARLGQLPRPTPAALRRVLRPVALVVLASAAFGALIGFAGAKREASASAWRQVREARQRLDPKSKTNDPEYWKKQLAEGEAKLQASDTAGVSGAVIAGKLSQTLSLGLLLAGLGGGLVLLRLRAEP